MGIFYFFLGFWVFEEKNQMCLKLLPTGHKSRSNFFIYCISFQASVMFNMGGNLRIGLFGVKILIFNFLKISLANDFDSFCMYLWVNPTKWPHKPFPWSFKINLCHVLERCATGTPPKKTSFNRPQRF